MGVIACKPDRTLFVDPIRASSLNRLHQQAGQTTAPDGTPDHHFTLATREPSTDDGPQLGARNWPLNVCKGSEVNLLQPWAAKAYRADKWRRRPVHQDFATKACPGIERRRCYIRSISPITQIDSCSVADSSIHLNSAPPKQFA